MILIVLLVLQAIAGFSVFCAMVWWAWCDRKVEKAARARAAAYAESLRKGP